MQSKVNERITEVLPKNSRLRSWIGLSAKVLALCISLTEITAGGPKPESKASSVRIYPSLLGKDGTL